MAKKETATSATATKKQAKAAKTAGPKRPMPAFFWFLGKRRTTLIAERPELKSQAKEVGKLLGDEWKAMTDAQKAPYQKMHEQDKKRYEAEKANASK